MAASDSSPDRGAAHGPQPTAHEVTPGCTLTRRQALQSAAIASAMLAGGAASSGTVAADDDESFTDAQIYDPSLPSLSDFYYSRTIYGAWYDELTGSDDMTAEKVSLHSRAMAEKESYDDIFTWYSNWFEDASSVASIDARDAMARGWESGMDHHDGQSEAIDAIYDYYAQRQANLIDSAMKRLMTLALIISAAERDGDIDDNFVNPGIPDHSENHNFDTWRLESDAVDTDADGEAIPNTEFELVNGEIHETYCPAFHYETEEGDVFEAPISDDWIVGHVDSSGGTDSVELETDDGHTIEHTHALNVMNVPDADLQGFTAFWPVDDLIAPLMDIEDEAETVAGNYDLSLAEQLFDALDEGLIDPAHVRSAEGYARHMSGTDDVHEDRYQMALLMTLGLGNNALDDAASMSITLDGFSDMAVDTDDPFDGMVNAPERGFSYINHVNQEQFNGMLYARGATGVSPGGRYSINMPLLLNRWGASDDPAPVTFHDQSSLEPIQSAEHRLTDAVLSSDFKHIYIIDSIDSTLYKYDLVAEEGEDATVWTEQMSSDPYTIDLDSDGRIYVQLGSGSVRVLEDQGTEHSTVTTISPSGDADDMVASPADDLVFVAHANGITAYDTDGWEEQWSTSTETARITISPNGDKLFAATSGGIKRYDPQTGDIEWEISDGTAYDTVACNQNRLFRLDDDDFTAYAHDAETGDQQWQSSDSHFGEMAMLPHGEFVYVSGADDLIVALDKDTGLVDHTQDPGYEPDTLESPWSNSRPLDGNLPAGLFYDANSGDSIQITGVATVESMSDTDGEAITALTDQTITDIETQADRSIEDIIAEIDEIESVDDITGLDDLRLIAAHEDDVSLEDTDSNEQTYDEPQYEDVDMEEYAAYLDDIEEQLDKLAEEDEETNGDNEDGWGFGMPGLGDFDTGALAGLAVIGVAVMFVVGIVTDYIPLLGD